MNKCPDQEIKLSSRFNDPDAEITFRSSDNVIFRVHRKHINSASAGFEVLEQISVKDEHVLLDETASVLDVLFQFIHPPSKAQNYRQPSVTEMEITLFFELAEAAEKYIVFSAMGVCLMRMRQLCPQYSAEVLNHSFRHSYPDLVNQIAYETLSLPFPTVAEKLTHPGLLKKWLLYFDTCHRTIRPDRQLFIQSFDPFDGCRYSSLPKELEAHVTLQRIPKDEAPNFDNIS